MRTTHLSRQRQTRVPSRTHSRLRASRLTAMIAIFLVAVAMPVQGGSMNVCSDLFLLAAPANDDFANATALVGDSGTLNDETTEDATAEAGEPSHDSLPFTPTHSVWYYWTPSISGNAVIEVVIPFSGAWDPVLAVYTGSAVDALTESASTHTTGYRITLEMRVEAGTIYRVAVDGYDSTESGLFDLMWSIPSPPNDDLADATLLPGNVGTLVDESNAWATAEAGEPSHDGLTFTPARSVWYEWTPTTTATAEIGVSIPFTGDWDPVLAIYTGSAVSALTEIASTHTTGYGITLLVPVQAGTTYRIAVDGYDSTESGLFDLTWSIASPNDNFADAIVLGGDAGTLVAETNENATTEPGEPAHAGYGPARSVWYQWTPSSSGNAIVLATTQPYAMWDIVMGVYTGTAVDALTEVTSEGGLVNQVEVEFRVTAGTTYHIAVAGQTSDETGKFDLTWSIPSPPNDDFVNAIDLTGEWGWQLGDTNQWASAEPGEPAHAERTPTRSVWYRWTPPADGTAVVTGLMHASDYIIMAAYTGTAVDALTEVAAHGANGFSRVRIEFPVLGGTEYSIVLDGWDESEAGSFDLTWALSPPANDDFANPTVLELCDYCLHPGAGSLVGESSQGATPEIGELPHAGVPGTPARSVWYEWTAKWDGDATIDVSIPPVPDDWDGVVAVYTGNSLGALTEVASGSTTGDLVHLEFASDRNATYRIVVDSYGNDDFGTFDLAWTYDPYGGTWNVTKTEDTDDGACDADCSLREAVVAANDTGGDDTIYLPAGTYELTLDSYTVAEHYGSLDVDGGAGTTSILGAGRDVTIIDATTLRTLGIDRPDRVFAVGYEGGLDLVGVTVTGGYTENVSPERYGGGIWNMNGYLTVSDCIVEGNAAGEGGGGIANHVGPAIIHNTIIRNNTTDPPDYTTNVNYGGGIQNTGTMIITDSEVTGNSTNKWGFGGGIANAGLLDVIGTTISGNDAPVGGGIGSDYVGPTSGDAWIATVTSSAIVDNHADSNGGGISNSGGGIMNPGTDVTTMLIDSLVSGNTADGDGGGIHNDAGVVEVHRTTVSDNFADGGGSGGGILNGSRYTWMAGNLTVSNSTLSGNGATYGGGITNLDRGSTVISDTTVTNNISFNGGGIDNGGVDSSTVTAKNTIIAGNDSLAPGSEDCSGAVTSLGYNLVGDGTGCPTDGVGDILAIDPLLSPLLDFGGPTETHALLPGSPAIDAGTTDLSIDQRGILRPQGPADDIGAYEVEHGPNVPPVLGAVGDLTVDEGDTLDVTVSATNADGDPLVLWAAGAPGFVSLTDHGDGTATMSLVPGFHDAGSYPGVAIYVSDGVDIDDEVITIDVTDVNAVPVAEDQLVSTWQDNPVEITLTGSDVDGDELAYAVFEPPAHGDLSGTPPAVIYIPDSGFVGEDSFTYTVFDGNATSIPGTVSISVHNIRPDPTFGTDGTYISTFGGYGGPYAVVEQADGSILVAGWVRSTGEDRVANADAVVAKLTPDGTLDSTFGTGGVAVVSGRDNYFYDLAVEPDGQIVAVGESKPNAVLGGDPLIARFEADGTLDTGFGTSGLVMPDLDGEAATVALQPDGKIVVGGGWGTNEDLGVARLLVNGDLDLAFGTDGVTTVRHAGYDLVSEVLVQPDGSILLVGTIDSFNEWNEQDISLVRLLTDGSPDTTYGDDGEVIIDLGKAESGYGAALQADGKILIAGDTWEPYNRDAIVVRTTSSGELDPTFGTDGVANIAFGEDFEQFNELVLQPDGTIVVAGSSGAAGYRDFIVARALSDGSLDQTFDYDGKVTHDLGDDDAAWALAVQTNGKLLLAGETGPHWAVLRLMEMGNNHVPVLDPIADQSLAEAETLDVGITASDADDDPLFFNLSGEPDFAALVDHGDGTATLSLTPGFYDAGVYPGVVVIVSDRLASDSETFNITVTMAETESLFLPLVLRGH